MFIFFNNFKTIKFTGQIEQSLYEHSKHTDLRVLIKEEPAYILSAPVESVDTRIRTTICLCEIIVLRTVPNYSNIELTEPVYLGILKITDYELQIHLYPCTFLVIQERATAYFASLEPIILLDLDKTLIVSDCDVEGDKTRFQPEFTIRHLKALDGLPFENRVMIRPGCHEFLQRLFRLTSKVYIITAADLHYAQSIVNMANERGWGSGSERGSIHFPIEKVYSVRHLPHIAMKKKFTHIIPNSLTTLSLIMVAVDDIPSAWDATLSSFVIPIVPFQPESTTAEELKKIVELIEKNTSVKEDIVIM